MFMFSLIPPLLIVSLLQSSDVQARRLTSYEKSAIPSCEQFYNTTNCYYYSCLDAIYQCGVENVLVQFLYSFCDATLDRLYSSLTTDGQSWVRATQTCLMQELHEFFLSTPTLTCSHIDQLVMERSPICFTQAHQSFSLCSIMCENLAVFLKIFDNWDLKTVNLRRFFLEASRLCPEQSQMEKVIDVSQATIRTILWSICLDLPKGSSGKFQPDLLMSVVDPQPSLFSENIEEQQ